MRIKPGSSIVLQLKIYSTYLFTDKAILFSLSFTQDVQEAEGSEEGTAEWLFAHNKRTCNTKTCNGLHCTQETELIDTRFSLYMSANANAKMYILI